MRDHLKETILAGLLFASMMAGASKFVGTDIEDPGSPGRARLLERTYEHGKAITQNARTHLHELGLSDESMLVLKLRRGGIQVVMLGDQVRVVIPTKAFFEPGTSMVREDKAEVLGILHDFVAHFPTTSIKVVGHSDFLGEKKRQLKYSMQVARVVAGYLWANGISQDHISITGVGSTDPVTDSYTGTLNSRIEVLFKNKRA